MAKTKIDFKSLDLPAVAKTPLYAYVGAGDLAVTAVKEYVADLQKSVNDFNAKKLRDSALERAAARRNAIEARVSELQAEALALPSKGQNVALDYVGTVTGTYADLAKRGEAVVRGTKLPSTATVEVKLNTTNPAARKNTRKPAVKKATPVKAATKSATTTRKASAKKTATKPATKPAVTKTGTSTRTATTRTAATKTPAGSTTQS